MSWRDRAVVLAAQKMGFWQWDSNREVILAAFEAINQSVKELGHYDLFFKPILEKPNAYNRLVREVAVKAAAGRGRKIRLTAPEIQDLRDETGVRSGRRGSLATPAGSGSSIYPQHTYQPNTGGGGPAITLPPHQTGLVANYPGEGSQVGEGPREGRVPAAWGAKGQNVGQMSGVGSSRWITWDEQMKGKGGRGTNVVHFAVQGDVPWKKQVFEFRGKLLLIWPSCPKRVIMGIRPRLSARRLKELISLNLVKRSGGLVSGRVGRFAVKDATTPLSKTDLSGSNLGEDWTGGFAAQSAQNEVSGEFHACDKYYYHKHWQETCFSLNINNQSARRFA